MPTKSNKGVRKPKAFSMSEVFARPVEQFNRGGDLLEQAHRNAGGGTSSSSSGAGAGASCGTAAVSRPPWIPPSYSIIGDENSLTNAVYIKICRSSLGQKIAIKSMKWTGVSGADGASSAASAGDNKSPLRELDVARMRIMHPNVIRYFACAPPSETSNFVRLHMQFCDRLCMHHFASELRALVERKKAIMTATGSGMGGSSGSSLGVTTSGSLGRGSHNRRPSNVTFTAAATGGTANSGSSLTPSSPPSSPQQNASSGISSGGGSSGSSGGASPGPLQQPPLNGIIEGVIKSLCRQALLGLVSLHEMFNLLWRDAKLGNFLVDSTSGHFKITDFGTTITDSPGDSTPTARGTLKYYAPELFCGRFNKKVDVWGLGCSLLYFKLRVGYGDGMDQWPESAQRAAQWMAEHRVGDVAVNFLCGGGSQEMQRGIDGACDRLFVDVGLRHLVKLMLRVRPSERVTATRALAWTFVLTPAGSNELALQQQNQQNQSSKSSAAAAAAASISRSSEQQNCGSSSSLTSAAVGWPSLHESQRNLQAEQQLQRRGIVSADATIVAVCDAIEYRAQRPRMTKRASLSNKLETDVTAIDNALTKELTALASCRPRGAGATSSCCANSSSGLSPTTTASPDSPSTTAAASAAAADEFDVIQEQYSLVVARRQTEQCRILREVCSFVPKQ